MPGASKQVPHDEWGKMYQRLAEISDSELSTIWENLENYDPKAEYAPGISMDYWGSAVYSELDKRGLPHPIHIDKGANNGRD